MNFLEIKDRKSYFIVDDNRIKPKNLTKNNLFEILNLVYESSDSIEFPSTEDIDSIVNPIDKEIIEQIVSKIVEFQTNVPTIQSEIESQFPSIND